MEQKGQDDLVIKWLNLVKNGELAALEQMLSVYPWLIREAVGWDGTSSLMSAAKWGHAQCVRLLLGHDNVQAKTQSEDKNALHFACMSGNVECVQVLAQHLDVNAVDKNGFSALHYAAIGENDSAKMIQLLLEGGAKTSLCDKSKAMMPMHWAALKGNVEGLKVLLQHTHPLVRCGDDKNALMLAAANGKYECVKLLTSEKSLAAVECTGMNALMLACAAGKSIDCVRWLMQCTDVKKVDHNGRTALHHGARWGHTSVVQELIEHVPVQVKDRSGKTALDMAREKGQKECVRVLEQAMARWEAKRIAKRVKVPNKRHKEDTSSCALAGPAQKMPEGKKGLRL